MRTNTVEISIYVISVTWLCKLEFTDTELNPNFNLWEFMHTLGYISWIYMSKNNYENMLKYMFDCIMNIVVENFIWEDIHEKLYIYYF